MCKIDLQEHWKEAQQIIHHYDGYSMRCKQWLTAVVGAALVASYQGRATPESVIFAAFVGVVVLFGIETTMRVVSKRAQNYCLDVEDKMAIDAGHADALSIAQCRQKRVKAMDLRLAHAMRADAVLANAMRPDGAKASWLQVWWHVWWQFIKALQNIWRPGVFVPYVGAFLLVVAGCYAVAPNTKEAGVKATEGALSVRNDEAPKREVRRSGVRAMIEHYVEGPATTPPLHVEAPCAAPANSQPPESTQAPNSRTNNVQQDDDT